MESIADCLSYPEKSENCNSEHHFQIYQLGDAILDFDKSESVQSVTQNEVIEQLVHKNFIRVENENNINSCKEDRIKFYRLTSVPKNSQLYPGKYLVDYTLFNQNERSNMPHEVYESDLSLTDNTAALPSLIKFNESNDSRSTDTKLLSFVDSNNNNTDENRLTGFTIPAIGGKYDGISALTQKEHHDITLSQLLTCHEDQTIKKKEREGKSLALTTSTADYFADVSTDINKKKKSTNFYADSTKASDIETEVSDNNYINELDENSIGGSSNSKGEVNETAHADGYSLVKKKSKQGTANEIKELDTVKLSRIITDMSSNNLDERKTLLSINRSLAQTVESLASSLEQERKARKALEDKCSFLYRESEGLKTMANEAIVLAKTLNMYRKSDKEKIEQKQLKNYINDTDGDQTDDNNSNDNDTWKKKRNTSDYSNDQGNPTETKKYCNERQSETTLKHQIAKRTPKYTQLITDVTSNNYSTDAKGNNSNASDFKSQQIETGNNQKPMTTENRYDDSFEVEKPEIDPEVIKEAEKLFTSFALSSKLTTTINSKSYKRNPRKYGTKNKEE